MANDNARKAFPGAGVDLIEHLLTIDLYKVGGAGKSEKLELLESLKFDGRMTVERSHPRIVEHGVNKGRKQITFMVRTWAASTFSTVLGMEILYVLSDDIEQKPCTITAEQDDMDFPATFEFNVIFDVRGNNQVLLKHHHGRPLGRGFHTIPPNGNRKTSPTIVEFEKNYVQLKHPKFGQIRFVPRDCNDKSGVTVVDLSAQTE